jgi:hypothetical protein
MHKEKIEREREIEFHLYMHIIFWIILNFAFLDLRTKNSKNIKSV